MIRLSVLLFLLASPLNVVLAANNAPEVGDVNWDRDFDSALEASRVSGKPVFALFQEVPGCQGCKEFGQIVLREPLIVEAIESEFIPILIYNNRSGKDAELLKRFREPAWNFQVIRFFDYKAQDIIPRRDRVWTTAALSRRMIEALEKRGRGVPEYLKSVYYSHAEKSEFQRAAFSMYCFWTGERVFGGIDGVLSTEAGFIRGREATLVHFDPAQVSLIDLIEIGGREKCADKVYLPKDTEIQLPKGRFELSEFDLRGFSRAPESDQKRQLRGVKLPQSRYNGYQLMKLNAFIRSDSERALSYLSPRQRSRLSR